MQQYTRNPALDHLDALVGEWETEATHPYFPGTVIHGHATFEWLGGGFFLIWRAGYDHPDIPDSVAILGCDDETPSESGCSMHYFDSRGIARIYSLGADHGVWRFWREWPGFSQRYIATISADGGTITGNGELSRDGSTWEQDLRITYRRLH
jgi:hypothetical protein